MLAQQLWPSLWTQSLPHQESIRGKSMQQPGKKENKNKNKITLFKCTRIKGQLPIGENICALARKLIKWLVNDYRCNLETKDIRAMT